MIVDTMTKTEVMRSLQKEFREEILPFYNRSVLEIKKNILPRIQRTGKSEKIQRSKDSSGKNTFMVIIDVSKEGHNMCSYCIFFWRGKKCYANFFYDNDVIVYQKHCLERYAERVLGRKDLLSDDVFKKYLFNRQNSAFQISLQAPKRERCQYFGLADALFLGDYDEPTMENKKECFHWYNTCISLKEAHITQTGILQSLSLMQKFVQDLGFNPIYSKLKNKSAKKDLEKYINKGDDKKQSYIEYLKRMYMLHQLQLSLEFPWIELYKEEIDIQMNEISSTLAKYGINSSSLSPFGKKVGFAIKGEINYIPS